MNIKYELLFKVADYPWKKFDTFTDLNDKMLLDYYRIYKSKGFKVKVVKITREAIEFS